MSNATLQPMRALRPRSPDPHGEYFRRLAKWLKSNQHVKAVFWDWVSLSQRGGRDVPRTDHELAVFKRGVRNTSASLLFLSSSSPSFSAILC